MMVADEQMNVRLFVGNRQLRKRYDVETITIPSDDVVWIAGKLYCKTPRAKDIALKTLRKIGYEVKDTRTDSYSLERATPEKMEKNGWSLWHASLKDIQHYKCKSCNAYISGQGIQMHGHQCEACGAVTYYEMSKGSTLKFTFRGEERGLFSPELQMQVERWDTDEGFLYLLLEFGESRFGVMGPDESKAYLAKNADKWLPAEIDGQPVIKLRHPLRHWGEPVKQESVIDRSEVWGHHFNYTEVKLWEGKEYSKYDRSFPLPDYVSIYETWHWAPLESSETLHERIIMAAGQVSDAGYYYQDGRAAWSAVHYEWMGAFIRHFTTLDADKWDRVSPTFPLDGPRGIIAVATFCHPNPIVENRPNIGNFLVAAGDALNGRTSHPDTVVAANRALAEDPDTQEFAGEIKRGFFRRKK